MKTKEGAGREHGRRTLVASEAHAHATIFWLDHREAAFASLASGPHGAIGYKATCVHKLRWSWAAPVSNERPEVTG